jgi:phosphate transport system protein
MAYRSPAEADLERIRTLFLQMCVRAESMVRLAVRSLVDRDQSLGRSVVQADIEVDRLELEIDRLCVRFLAVRQPVGTELRTITTILKMVTDLERIGDLSVSVAERGLELSSGVGLEPGLDLPRMAELAADMVRMAADAFLDGSATMARDLILRDRDVDELNRQAFRKWTQHMVAYPDQVDRAFALVSVSKNLERVADHACNLAEMIVFLVEGRDVRHTAFP